MRVAVGTSGYAYKEWKGHFYPEDLKAADYLRYYASKFASVEINNTFYRMPNEKLLLQWAEQVPESFTFVLKAPQKITHMKRLKGAGEDTQFFLRTAAVLEGRLGPTLFQLPPNMKKDLERLQDFLTLLPLTWRPAFEFRHATWFDPDVYALLSQHNASLVIADTDPEESGIEVPFVRTAGWGYLRLRRVLYDEDSLRAWAAKLKDTGWSDAFVYFKHEDEGTGPKLAARFMEILA